MSANQRPQPSTSMASAIKDAHLLVAVIDMPIPGIIKPLTKENYKKIFNALNMFLVEEVKKKCLNPNIR